MNRIKIRDLFGILTKKDYVIIIEIIENYYKRGFIYFKELVKNLKIDKGQLSRTITKFVSYGIVFREGNKNQKIWPSKGFLKRVNNNEWTPTSEKKI